MKSLIEDKNGAALIEFVIVLIPLLILLFASIEFGFLFFNKAMLTNASREGARQGIVFNDTLTDAQKISLIEQTVNNYCANHLVTFGSTNSPVLHEPTSIPARGDDLMVRASWDYDFLVLPNFIGLLPQTKTLTAESVMRME